ncbi:MAG: GAF domain-containing protein [Chloroflexi bacterium]|nr:GAF domain-containing protein [Chloroflexota bacterium]MBU1750550.1 GAF domain-containing protein [Chloroflexota bacterium]MBU1878283.1 GAF domain-containing protein [Chloroflexota bacterium]
MVGWWESILDNTTAADDHSASLRQGAEDRGAEDLAALSPEETRQLVHELQVHQIELEMQNEELRRAQEELEAARARYFDLYDLAPVGYLTLSESGLILQANLTAATLLGATLDVLVKQPLTRYILPEDQDIYYRYRQHLLAAGTPQVCELRVRRTDNSLLWVRLEGAVVLDTERGAPRLVCHIVLSDITARQQAEAETRASERLLRTITANLPNSYLSIVEKDLTIGYTAGLEFARLGLDPASFVGLTLEQVFGVQAPLVREHYLQAFAGAEVEFEMYINGQYQHYTAVPLVDEHGAIPHVLAVAENITERKRAERALERRSHDLEQLNRLGRELGATLDLTQVLDRVLAAAREVVASSGGAVWLWDPPRPDWLACRAAFHPDLAQPLLNLRLRTGEGIAGWVAQHGQSVVVAHASQDPRFSSTIDAQTGFQTRSILAVPLWGHDAITGVLEMVNKPGDEFDDHDRILLETLAGSAAIAIENARLHGQAQQAAAAAERSQLARELHDAVSQTLFSASVIAESLPRLWERNPEAVRRGLDQLHQLTRGALAEMRMLLLELRPAALLETDLCALLIHVAEALAGRTGVEVFLDRETQCTCPLPDDVRIALYRITQETLNNTAKHARASRIAIRLHCQSQRLELHICDDGRGFDPAHVPPGRLGLHILSERAQAIGAVLHINSHIGQGTEVVVTWPDPAKLEEIR